MTARRLVGWTAGLLAGYVLFKWGLAGRVEAERFVALGGMYHWTALVVLTVASSMTLVRGHHSSGKAWADFRWLVRPLMGYALLASLAVWGWNHVVAAETTELRKALRKAQIEENTSSEAAFTAWVQASGSLENLQIPDRLTYREQALSQVDWMLSGSVTLVLSLVMYTVAAWVLAGVSTLLLHHIWGIASLG